MVYFLQMKKILQITLVAAFVLVFNTEGLGQVNISAGSTITENFDGMGASDTAYLPTGWKVDKNTTVRKVGSYSSAGTQTERLGGNNIPSTNGIYNFGAGDAASAGDRAVGGLSSGTASKSVNVYVQLKNTGSVEINYFTISYDVEKYRKGINPAGFSIQMYYSINGTDWDSTGNDFLTSFIADGSTGGYSSAPGETKKVMSKTLTLTPPLTSGNSIYLAWNYSVTSGTTTTYAQALGIDDVVITAHGSAVGPTISVNPASLQGFTYYLGYGPSEEQSFLVSGTNLTENIVLKAPTNYEISTSSGEGFTDSLNISQIGGTVAITTIYVRLKAGLDLGDYNSENITVSSTGADNKIVSCSGTVSLAPVTGLSLICSLNTTAEITWTSPECDYDGVVIAFRQSENPPHVLNGDPSTIVANSVFGSSGTSFGSTDPYSYVVYKGTGNLVEVTGLTAGQTYKVKAYVYKGTTWLPDNQCPTITISNLGLSDVNLAQSTDGDMQSELSWVLPSAACFDEIIVVAKQNTNVTYNPTGDALGLTANSIFGSGDTVASGEYVVYKGTGTTLTITGLTNDTTYYAKIFVRKGTDWSNGIELTLKPRIYTVLEHGDLAILAVNTQSGFGTSGDEISIVCFKAIVPNTSIDFTDNCYERASAGKWGDTEGTIRITRINTTLNAGKVITFEIQAGSPSPNITIGTDINIYVDGLSDNVNWTVEKLGGSNRFDLNPKDQLWIMQNGSWINPSGSNNAIYTGNVLYGWTATGWESAPGYNSTEGSTIYPGSECATTNVSGLTNYSKVKYTGNLDAANKFEWIGRIKDTQNWTGWDTNSQFQSGGPNYRDGISIDVEEYNGVETKWTGNKSTDWCECLNWYNFRVPTENSDVEIPQQNVSIRNLELSDQADPSAVICRNLIVKGNITNLTNASLKVKGNFTLEGGSINFDSNTINLEIGGNVNIDNSGNFKVSEANIKLNGSENQNINGNSEIVFGALTIDKPSSDVIIGKDIAVNTLNLIKGKITTGDNRVYINNPAINAIITNVTNLSCINGNLRRAVAQTGSYTIPVGNASNLELATIVLNSSSGLTYLDIRFDDHITASMDISPLNLRVGGTLIQTLLDAGYWSISPNPGLTEVNYDIKLDMRGATNIGDNATQHTVVKRDDSSSDWYLQGNHENETQSITDGAVHAERTGLDSFSQFSIAKNNETVLPVELISFEAKCNNNYVELIWITATETHSDYFIVQKSNDAISWKNLGEIQAAGNSSSISKYKYIDINRVSGNLYYRLIQVDFDGTTSLSNIVSVNCSDEFENLQNTIYPNPANDILYFSEAHSFKIFDIYGRLLNQSEIEQSSVNISDLKKGMYYIKFKNNLLKFIKN